MKLPEGGNITMLASADGMTIELRDTVSRVRFAKVTLTAEQLAMALGRLSETPCEIEVLGLESVGKYREQRPLIVPIPDGLRTYSDRDKIREVVKAACPEGWQPDLYLGSKGSFTTKDGVEYANTRMVRYVDTRPECARPSDE